MAGLAFEIVLNAAAALVVERGSRDRELFEIHAPLLSIGTLAEVFEAGWFILGRRLESFERAFAAFLGAPQVPAETIAVANGTDALVIAVSEETGSISVVMGGEIVRGLSAPVLRQLWRQVRETQKAAQWTESTMDAPPWKGVRNLKQGSERCFLTSPLELH